MKMYEYLGKFNEQNDGAKTVIHESSRKKADDGNDDAEDDGGHDARRHDGHDAFDDAEDDGILFGRRKPSGKAAGIHEFMPARMEDCMSDMGDEDRKNLLGFCRGMLDKMEKKFSS
jgi:hypothetical protein